MNLGLDPVGRFLQLGIGAMLALALVLVALKRPWWAAVAAIASLPLLPVWAGISVGVFFVSAHMALLGLASVAIVLERRTLPRSSWVDLVVLAVLIALVVGYLLGLNTLTQPYSYFQWLLGYAFARIVAWAYGLRRAFTAIAVSFGIAAIAILIEFASGFNLWAQYLVFDNSLFTLWSPLQSRGGTLRAEGAFGHSIAAGCSLAVAAVLALDAKLRPSHRIILVLLLCAATLATISRIGIVTAALGIGLAVAFARTTLSSRAKLVTLTVGVLGAVVYATTLTGVFAEAGSEATNSASYRFWLLDLLPYLRPFGIATGATRSTTGDLSYGGYASVDNALLYFALSNGWVLTLVLVVPMIAAALQVLRLRAGVAAVALVAAIPSLFTVALITQWALVFWLVAGLAVGESQAVSSAEKLPEQIPLHR